MNKVVPADGLLDEARAWCDEICDMSPTALKFLDAAFNADTDHMYGCETMAVAAVRLSWGTDEAAAATVSQYTCWSRAPIRRARLLPG